MPPEPAAARPRRLRGLATLWELELVRTAKAPVLVVTALGAPLAWLFLFGLTFQEGLALRFQGFDYALFMAPGLAVLLAMGFALASGVRTMGDKQVGFLREVLVAPVGRMEIVLGRTLGVCTIVTLQALLLLGLPALVGQGPPMPLGLLSVAGVALAVSLISLGFVGLGIVMAVRGRNPQSFQALLGLLTLPMFFLSGAILPVENLPAWAQVLAAVNPATYAVDLARQAALGAATASYPAWLDTLGLVGFALFTLSAGARSLVEG